MKMMMKPGLLLIPLLMISACGTSRKTPATEPLAAASDAVEAAVPARHPAAGVMRKPLIDPQKSEFALRLLGTALSASDLNDNLVLSPYSAGVALSLLMDGAAGSTQQSLREALSYATYAGTELYSDSLNTVSSANSIWLRTGIDLKQNYRDYVTGDTYAAQVETRDFADRSTVARINDWCSRQTRGRIPSIVDRLDPSLAAVLLNALYFKAPWAEEFAMASTFPETFHSPRGDGQVPFMHKTSRDYAYARSGDWQFASLPYRGGRYAMLIALPPQDADMKALAPRLDADLLNALLESLAPGRRVALSLPKFKVETTLTMNDVLTRMGAGPAFGDGADFSRMSATPLAVDRVIQKCFVEVSEEGTEAAAVTGAFMRVTSVAREDPPVQMKVDRPFFFAVYDTTTRLILFEGRIANI